MNIYVGNLPFDASEDEIRQEFAAFGEVASVTLIKDRVTGQARGFGFIEMPNATEAQAAIAALNGKEFKNRRLTVNPARPKEEGGGGGRTGGGGGYNRDRGSSGGGDRRGGQGGTGGNRRGGW